MRWGILQSVRDEAEEQAGSDFPGDEKIRGAKGWQGCDAPLNPIHPHEKYGTLRNLRKRL
jgi:hypothetical protein